MILSTLILIAYMALVGKAKVEMEILYQLGACEKPSSKDTFFIEPYYTIKFLITDVAFYCWACINDKYFKGLVSNAVDTVKLDRGVDNGGESK